MERAKFQDLPLKESILRGIFGYGFESPSAIQAKGIIPMIEGKDCICQAQSGSGKTGAFVIGSMERIDLSSNNLQVIILSPTREFASQTENVIDGLNKYFNAKILSYFNTFLLF